MENEIILNEEEYLSQMNEGKLLNPRIDSTFKALFTQPTEDSEKALKSFLEAVIGKKVDKFELMSNNAVIDYVGQRDVAYDILCTFADGEIANIEMQAFNQNYDYGSRAEYHVARLESTYFAKGGVWGRNPKVYQINILNFIYHKGKESGKNDPPVRYYSMRTKEGEELANMINIIMIELPKVEKLLGSIERNTAIENWAIFFRYADDINKKELIKELIKKEEGLMSASQSLSIISEDRDYWIQQYRREMREIDERSARQASEEIGMKKGRADGIKEGMKKGKAEGILEERKSVVKKLLDSGMSEKQISDILGIDFKGYK